ncbi:MAG: aminoglycoside phosphotransferase family protein [Elusimicrobiota bacterium]
MDPRPQVSGGELQAQAERLAASAGFRGAARISDLPGGANNRVFLVELAEARLLLKSYFREGADSAERLGVEFGFSAFLWENGLRQGARPLARDEQALLALYEYVEGRPCEKKDVTAETVRQAARFFHDINLHRSLPQARALPAARDACFSLSDHLSLVSKRLERFESVLGASAASALERDALAFVRTSVVPYWDLLRASMNQGEEPIPAEQRRLSPSDFGFHNALIAADGQVRFFDFEYAGWDDPAKMIVDFFSQVSVPVPEEHFDLFCGEAIGDADGGREIKARATRVLAVHRLKWIFLMLNDFLPAVEGRRRFAFGAEGAEERKAKQLEKARRALKNLEERKWHT